MNLPNPWLNTPSHHFSATLVASIPATVCPTFHLRKERLARPHPREPSAAVVPTLSGSAACMQCTRPHPISAVTLIASVPATATPIHIIYMLLPQPYPCYCHDSHGAWHLVTTALAILPLVPPSVQPLGVLGFWGFSLNKGRSCKRARTRTRARTHTSCHLSPACVPTLFDSDTSLVTMTEHH